eukprot:TRINITY_DN3539_c0_g1_i1.p1 TRINITY_DN3539_c0_g1~~TRINITY_DN3539_c0_g1_i1.p1  ORF type:complete len:313 (-),score=111.93 TRINITY_DN3539_c0_g1_i1:26-964(-)
MSFIKFNNGKIIPALGVGTWKIPGNVVGQVIKDSIKIGYRHIDCAHIYDNEKQIGEALKDVLKEVKREELFITSKLWNSYHEKERVEEAVRITLQNLGLEYLDLYLVHWPIAFGYDTKNLSVIDLRGKDFNVKPEYIDEVPISQTWEAMENLVNKGLVKSIGVSNFTKSHLKDLLETAKIKPVCNQIEHHPYLQQKDLVQYFESFDIKIVAYSPLAQGRQKEPPHLIDSKELKEIAESLGENISTTQVILRWMTQKGKIAIPKSTSFERLKENFESQSFTLSEQQINVIDSLDCNKRLLFGWINNQFKETHF